ncbi:recombination-associated protein RdgC [Endozoicomonas sp. OPT23]|uniref:recombination-associated protein RdgC n=1 Tax=Endozoicomonas sp. OPT23 TaxID=2072845 RepID=UPI00129A4FD0|nr:recombination-associated protein RdgC [Endozoicomonas sp. OPT23]MRI35294.1 recombination-associated protein RdgC [Endozoicomonas sp. OPT23]
MWFKNLIFYRFTQKFELSTEELEEKLTEKRFRSCGSQDVSTYGWVPPLGKHGDMLTHASGDFVLICARREEKILPSSVIKDALEEKIETIEQNEHREVFSKEKKALKEDVTMELLPKAFTKSQNTLAYIDTKEGWIVVDASSFKKAEELTSCLRECLGSLPVVNPPLKNMPSVTMTQWLNEKPHIEPPFVLGHECDLREAGDEGGQVNVRKQELITDEIKAHLEAGMQVSKLALLWDDAQSFVLGDDLIVRKLKFTEVIQDQLDDISADTAAEQFDADFSVMTLSLRKLINDLIDTLGGFAE